MENFRNNIRIDPAIPAINFLRDRSPDFLVFTYGVLIIVYLVI